MTPLPLQAKLPQNASAHQVTVNALRLHYLESGAPDPNVPPELGKAHRAIALDLPGYYGLSDKPLDAFLDALGPPKAAESLGFERKRATSGATAR